MKAKNKSANCARTTTQPNPYRKDVNPKAAVRLLEWANDELDALAANIPSARTRLRVYVAPPHDGPRSSIELYTDKLIVRFLLKGRPSRNTTLLTPQYRRISLDEVDCVQWKYRAQSTEPVAIPANAKPLTEAQCVNVRQLIAAVKRHNARELVHTELTFSAPPYEILKSSYPAVPGVRMVFAVSTTDPHTGFYFAIRERATQIYKGRFGYRKYQTAADRAALEFADRLIDEAPEVSDEDRAPMLFRFCFELARKKLLLRDIQDAADFLNNIACHPPLAAWRVLEVLADAIDEARTATESEAAN